MKSIWEKVGGAFVVAALLFAFWHFFGRAYFTRNTKTIRLGFTHETMEAIPILAEVNGYYKEKGLTVTIKEYITGKDALLGLVAGEIDFAPTAVTPFIIQAIEGADIKVITSMSYADDQLKILTRKESNINTLSQLKGKKIGVIKGITSHYFVSKVLENNRIDENQIVYLFATTPEELISLIVSNQVDVICIKEPFLTQAATQLGARGVIHRPEKVSKKIYSIASTGTFINSNQETVELFLSALAQAEQKIIDTPDQARSQFSDYSGVSKIQVKEQWDTTVFELTQNDFFLEELAYHGAWATANGLTINKFVPDGKELIYTAGLRKAKPQGQHLSF